MYYDPFFITEMTRMVIGITVFAVVFVLGLSVIGNWLIFSKAGEHPWAALIPFYNSYVLHRMTWGQGWMFLIPIVLGMLCTESFFGTVCSLLLIVFHGLTSYKLSLSFGHGIGFEIGLFFIPFLFRLIIGLSDQAWFGIPLDGMTYEDLKKRLIKVDRDHMTFHNPHDDFTE